MRKFKSIHTHIYTHTHTHTKKKTKKQIRKEKGQVPTVLPVLNALDIPIIIM